MSDEKVIRPSSTPGWRDCARREAAKMFRRELIGFGYDDLRTPATHIGAHVGTGVHGGVAEGFREKKETGLLAPADRALEASMAAYDDAVERQGVTWDEITGNRNDAQHAIGRMLMSYRETLADQIIPMTIEERLETAYAPGFIISGQADLTGLVADGAGLRDTKTGRIRRNNLTQYGCYVLQHRAYDVTVYSFTEDFVQRVGRRKEQPPPISTEISLAAATREAWAVLQDIERAWNEFMRRLNDDTGDWPEGAFPANPNSMLCSEKFCPAYRTKFCRAPYGD